jgi:Uroporphyrinogen-III decarboxylase
MKEWVQNILKSKTKCALPLVTYPGLEFTGKTILDIVTNGVEQAKCAEEIAIRFPSLAGIMVMDLSVEAEAFGAKVTFNIDEVPSVKGRLIHDLTSIKKLQIPQVGDYRTGEYIKAAAIASERIKSKPVFGGIIGPYSLAGRLYGITEIMTLILSDPENAHQLVTKCYQFLCKYALAYKRKGVNGIIIAEPAAGLLHSEACDEFSSKYINKIVDYVQDDEFMVILHNCGNTEHLVTSMISTGSMGYHFGNAVDMLKILPQIPDNLLVFGNVDPVGIIKNSKPDAIKNTVSQLLNNTTAFKNFVLSTGCDVPPGTPISNIKAFYYALSNQSYKSHSNPDNYLY